MHALVEVKYQKVQIDFGQRLQDLPAYQRWRSMGWRVAWSYKRIEAGRLIVDTLLRRAVKSPARALEWPDAIVQSGRTDQ